MPAITVRDRQNALDIGIQEGGSAEAAVLVAIMNGVSITGELATGQQLLANSNLAHPVVAALRREGRKPASGGSILLEGIDYWIVESDFKVQ